MLKFWLKISEKDWNVWKNKSRKIKKESKKIKNEEIRKRLECLEKQSEQCSDKTAILALPPETSERANYILEEGQSLPLPSGAAQKKELKEKDITIKELRDDIRTLKEEKRSVESDNDKLKQILDDKIKVLRNVEQERDTLSVKYKKLLKDYNDMQVKLETEKSMDMVKRLKISIQQSKW
ncbi:unnamed protein product [Owenia fusiformis]|uniref:Uncharacterized protein n=1 Tax=Owenia fusiformis TaxID=6347 RepID=A0A8S4PKS9_OWEFU|nr:unnamed protein product [Owenia fusiformis]